MVDEMTKSPSVCFRQPPFTLNVCCLISGFVLHPISLYLCHVYLSIHFRPEKHPTYYYCKSPNCEVLPHQNWTRGRYKLVQYTGERINLTQHYLMDVQDTEYCSCLKCYEESSFIITLLILDVVPSLSQKFKL